MSGWVKVYEGAGLQWFDSGGGWRFNCQYGKVWRGAGWRWIDGGANERWTYKVEGVSGKRKLPMSWPMSEQLMDECISEPPVPPRPVKTKKLCELHGQAERNK